jgi:bifunctional DNA-binding transcriptional regulator/antitoxin component of YhaV-PrlF toxin-antitoxin module
VGENKVVTKEEYHLRMVDDVGRVHIPAVLRKELDIGAGESVVITVNKITYGRPVLVVMRREIREG